VGRFVTVTLERTANLEISYSLSFQQRDFVEAREAVGIQLARAFEGSSWKGTGELSAVGETFSSILLTNQFYSFSLQSFWTKNLAERT
jgi:hypothetical protein